MIDHLSLGVRDLRGAATFYRPVLAALGYGVEIERDTELAFGKAGNPALWLYPAEAGANIVGARMHVAFGAPSRAAVREAFAAATAHGARSVREPATRPEITPTYYGAVLHDPDGHVIEFACMLAQPD